MYRLRYNPGMPKKNLHAVALGKKGGKARAARLTPEELSKQGRKAVLARWRMRGAKQLDKRIL